MEYDMNIIFNFSTGPHKRMRLIVGLRPFVRLWDLGACRGNTLREGSLKEFGCVSDYDWKLLKVLFNLFYEIFK